MLGLSSADPAALPKYGYFGQDNDNTLMYGAARVVFKPEVKERTTFTFGDTLMQGMVPSPTTDPSLASMSPGQYEEILSVGGDPDDPYMENESANWGSADFDAAVENSLAGIPYVEAQIYGRLTPDDIAYVELPSENDMELTDPNTGLPIVDDPAALEHVRKLLDEKGIKWVEADLPGDYSGEWA